jgi:hypothetical protein
MASFIVGLFLSCFLCNTVWSAKVTKTLNFTWEEGAPNGQSREMIFTNGQFPGPSLHFHEDDDIEVHLVINRFDVLTAYKSLRLQYKMI